MPQSILELIFKTSKQGTGGKAAAAELKELKGTVGEATSGVLGFNLATVSGVGAAVAIGSAVVDATKKFIDYGETIRGISAITGTGTEETSRLMQAFDDLGISQEQFTALASGAAKKGFILTIDNVAKLADEYNGLATQEAKNALLQDKLGKGAMAAAKAFQEGGQAIRDAAAAQSDGLVLTEKEAVAAEKMRKNVDALTDAWEGFKLEVGGAVGGAIVATQDRMEKLREVVIATGKDVAKMDKAHQDLAIENYEVAKSQEWLNSHFKEGKELINGYTIGQKTSEQAALDYANAVGEAGQGTGTYTDYLKGATKATQSAEVAQGIYNKSLITASLELGGANTLMQEYTSQLLFNKAAAGLDADAALLLAEKMGLVEGTTATAMGRLADLRTQFDNNKISAEQYAAAVAGIDYWTSKLQDKTITLTTYHKEVYQSAWSYTDSQGKIHGNAAGGSYSYIIPAGFNENFPVAPGQAGSSGERVDTTITPKGKSSKGGSQLVGVVNIYNDMDLASFERLLMKATRK